jgi:trehalose 6-phosphate phosphatase
MRSALDRVGEWRAGWEASGSLVVLLDFDGTLAPIVQRPELAAIPTPTRAALERLRARPGVEIAVVSGRGLADVRARADLGAILYAGNHGMEIAGPGVLRVHPEAEAARPLLDRAAQAIEEGLCGIEGAFLEDKGLTLSVHYRLAPERAAEVHAIVERAVHGERDLHATTGKRVVEVRPRVDWDKGKAVLFLLEQIRPPAGAPVLYLGDDTTDEDAFLALARRPEGGEGVLVAEEPRPGTAALSRLASPDEVGRLFEALSGE